MIDAKEAFKMTVDALSEKTKFELSQIEIDIKQAIRQEKFSCTYCSPVHKPAVDYLQSIGYSTQAYMNNGEILFLEISWLA